MDCASFRFPAVRGYQAKREYYISMIPLGVIPQIFQFVDEYLPPEMRAQRILNKARIPEIRDYILDNPGSYVFSSMTVSVDGDMEFEASSEDESSIGYITIPLNAHFLINDGQHRRAAIAEAIRENPELKKEHISVVFYKDEGLMRSQQMFSDLNKYAIRPTKSINILFDNREDSALIAKRVIEDVPVFYGLTEKEHTSVSSRSKALFTLSAVCTATMNLLAGVPKEFNELSDIAVEYWTEVSKHMPQWQAVKSENMKASTVRKEYISSLSLTLVALGAGGNALLKAKPNNWKDYLTVLDQIDWRKENPIWENLVFINGKVAANRATQRAMSGYIEKLFIGKVGAHNG